MGGWTAKPQLGLSNALGAPVCNFLEKPKDLKTCKKEPPGGSFLQLFRGGFLWGSAGKLLAPVGCIIGYHEQTFFSII